MTTLYWIGFRVPGGARAFVTTSYTSYEEAMSEREKIKRFLQIGEELTPPLVAENEKEALEKMYKTYGS